MDYLILLVQLMCANHAAEINLTNKECIKVYNECMYRKAFNLENSFVIYDLEDRLLDGKIFKFCYKDIFKENNSVVYL